MISALDESAALYIAENMRHQDLAEAEALDHPGSTTPKSIAAGFMACAPSAWCAWRGLEPIAMVAANPLWPGVWQVGMFATPRFPEAVLTLTRFVVCDMIPAIKSSGAHRAHAYAMAGNPKADRWFKALGARQEARLTGFGRGGEDFFLYAWNADVPT